MSGTDDGENRSRGAGRSGSAGSIGKELGGDLDFEADALLDSLLSDAPPAPAGKTGRPSARPLSESPPSDGPMLHAPQEREYSEDEPTWVGNLGDAGLDIEAISQKAQSSRKAGGEVPPPPPEAAEPAIPALPPPPAFSPPRPAASIPRPGGVTAVPRPA
ncbi:MAG TPA: hypothetical protein VEQ58_23380, partial [Polyangiaceae bacterium]|nr:hypothetical protein [Polyangiaceae bacterium]